MPRLFPIPSGRSLHFTVQHCRIFFALIQISILFFLVSDTPSALAQQPDAQQVYQKFIRTYRYSPKRTAPPGTVFPETVRLRRFRKNSALALAAGLVHTCRNAGIEAWLVEGVTTGREKGVLLDDTTLLNHSWVVIFQSGNWILADPALAAGYRNWQLRRSLWVLFGGQIRLPVITLQLREELRNPKSWNIEPDSLLPDQLPVWEGWQLRTPAVPSYFAAEGPIGPWCMAHPSEGISPMLARLRFSDPAEQQIQLGEALAAAALPGKTHALGLYVQAGYSLSASRNTADRHRAAYALNEAKDLAQAAAQEPRQFYRSANHCLTLRRDSLLTTFGAARRLAIRERAAIHTTRNRLKGDTKVQTAKIQALAQAEHTAAKERNLATVRRARKIQEVRVNDLRSRLETNRQYVQEAVAVAAALLPEFQPLYNRQEMLYRQQWDLLQRLSGQLVALGEGEIDDDQTLTLFSLCSKIYDLIYSNKLISRDIKIVDDSIVYLFSMRNRLLYQAVLATRTNRNLLREIKSANHLPGDEDAQFAAEREKLKQLYQEMRVLRKDKKIYNKNILKKLMKINKIYEISIFICNYYQKFTKKLHQKRLARSRKFANRWNRWIKEVRLRGRERQTQLNRVLRSS